MKLSSGGCLCYSGRGDLYKREGVGLLMTAKAAKAMIEWNPVSSRILYAHFKSAQCHVTVIKCYASTKETSGDVKDTFYENLLCVIDQIPKSDMKLLLGDMNAKVGCMNDGCERTMGKNGIPALMKMERGL